MIESTDAQGNVPTLTIGLFTGLADRLKVLVSTMALCEATGKKPRFLWARTVHCGAAFSDVFRSSWPVEEETEEDVRELPLFDREDRNRRSDLLLCNRPEVAFRADGWLIDPENFPAHVPLMSRCEELAAELEPRAEILERVEAFRARAFRERMIGVHLRRADYLSFDARSAGSTRTALRAIDTYLEHWPEAGILLCTDDGGVDTFTGKPAPRQGVRTIMQERYGDRLACSQPRSLDRREPAAVQDALVDLLLLRHTDAIVGTRGSSFSEWAALGRGVPTTHCRSANTILHLRPWWQWMKGEMPTHVARRYYGRLFRQWLS